MLCNEIAYILAKKIVYRHPFHEYITFIRGKVAYSLGFAWRGLALEWAVVRVWLIVDFITHFVMRLAISWLKNWVGMCHLNEYHPLLSEEGITVVLTCLNRVFLEIGCSKSMTNFHYLFVSHEIDHIAWAKSRVNRYQFY